jgi:hypothetical protein
MKKIISILSIAFLLSACSFHTGNISSGAHIDCPMIYVATGTASTTRFLEIGGFNKEALIVEAKNDLYRKFPYKKGIKLTNFSVDYTNTYFFLFHTTVVTVSADVHDCNSIPGNDSIMNQIPAINGFRVGDSILYLYTSSDGEVSFKKAFIVNHTANSKVFIKNIGGKIAFTKKIEDIYKSIPDPENINNFGFNVGEMVFVNILNSESGIKSKTKCTIKGINSEKVIIEYLNSKNVISTQIVEKQFIRK